jgi:hypothetical protein
LIFYFFFNKKKLYAHKILKKLPENGDNQKFSSVHMFPTLAELFEKLDENLGFDIEIKYPQDLEVSMQCECNFYSVQFF